MDETLMTYPHYLLFHAHWKNEEGVEEVAVHTAEEAIEATKNWIHNLDHLNFDPKVLDWTAEESGEFHVALAKRSIDEWVAIEESVIEADYRQRQAKQAALEAALAVGIFGITSKN